MSKQLPPSKRHPFGERNNFPSLDNAFSQFVSAAKTNTSICSLDMSIGARADLTDHWRHVAKYGVDGDEDNAQEAPSSSQDLAWDQLLDGGPPLHALLSTTQPDGQEAVEVSLANVSCYSDYFNTSKVLLLTTPEKNKNRAPRRIFSRKEELDEDDDDMFNATINSIADSEVNLSHMFQTALHLDDEDDESFAGVDVSCISAADSERTPLRGSPSRSLFQSDTLDLGDQNRWMTDASPVKRWRGPETLFESSDASPIKDGKPPLRDFNYRASKPPSRPDMNTSFGSFISPMEAEAAQLAAGYDTGNKATPFPDGDFNVKRPPLRDYNFRSSKPPLRPDMNTSFGSFLSPMEAEAAQLAAGYAMPNKATPFPDGDFNLKRPPLRDFNFRSNKPPSRPDMNTSFGSFLSPMEAGSTVMSNQPTPFPDFNFPRSNSLFDNRPPSPISQANLSAIEFASMDGNSFLESTPHKESRSSSTLTPSPSNNEDRRRYRTVVPTRVFFDEPDDHRDDSFSIAPSEQTSNSKEELVLFDNDHGSMRQNV